MTYSSEGFSGWFLVAYEHLVKTLTRLHRCKYVIKSVFIEGSCIVNIWERIYFECSSAFIFPDSFHAMFN